MTRKPLILILTLLLAVTAGALAQETLAETDTATTKTTAVERPAAAEPATAKPAETAPAAVEEKAADEAASSPNSYQLRSDFGQTLRRLPPEVATVLTADPMLLSNQSYLAAYPELAKFVAEHPEVQRSPRFYLGEFQERPREDTFEQIFEGITIIATVSLIAFALSWLVRTIIEQRRWTRLSRIQTEVHNKILDRFSTSEELLAYVRSPAGSKFLESAPIPVATAQPPRPLQSGPVNRILWSFQIGAGVAVGAAGLLILSLRFDAETAEGIFGMGAIAFCVGAGFIASALVSLILSRRLGLTNGTDVPANPLDDSGVVR